jgi:hypothetical protein
VLSWAFGWIYSELGNPNVEITDTFSQATIDGVRYAAFAVSMIIVIQVVVRLGLLFRPTWNPYKKVNDDLATQEETVGIVDHE